MQNFIKRFLGIFLAALMVTSVISASAVYTPVTIEDVLEAAETADSLTMDWYGTMDGIFFEDGVDEGAVPEGVKQSLIFYKAFREGNFLKLGADSVALQRGLFAFSDVEAALAGYNARALQVEAMEQRVKEAITHANVTLRVRGAEVSGDSVCLDVLEWTFYDYDDTSVDGITTDAAGYGVEHKISLVKSGRYWLISEDEYKDEFLEDVTSEEASAPPEKKLKKAAPKAIANKPPVAPKYTYCSSYNINAAVSYSNTWANGRNPNYADFSNLGGDCANFTSQCIYAGGMPQVAGSNYGQDGWFYNTGSNRSGTWTMAWMLYSWMSRNRGKGLGASSSTVWKGCPCFVVWHGSGTGNINHAYFCVGYNSAGTPLINSHTGYQYHQVWCYGYSDSSYYTVQLTSSKNGGSTPPPPPPSVSIDASYAGNYKCTASPNLRIRSGPGTQYAELGNIPLNATVHVDGRTSNNWAKLTYNGVTGYSSMDYLEKLAPPPPPTIDTSYAGNYRCTANPNLRIRSGPGTGYTEIGNIPLNATVHVDGRTPEGWAKLTYNGVTGYSSMDYLEKIIPPPPVTNVSAPVVEFSGGAQSVRSYVMAYNATLTVSWGAVAHATRYDYVAYTYNGEWTATGSTKHNIVNSSTTGTSFTLTTPSIGKYIYVTVTAVGPSNSASIKDIEVLIGPWAAYPTNVQYIPLSTTDDDWLNGSEAKSGSMIWTKDKGKAFPAKFWRAMLCSPNTDGTYTVNSIYEEGVAKSVEVTGTNLLFVIHSAFDNFKYADAIKVGDKLSFIGTYIDAKFKRGTPYVLVNGGKSLAVAAPDVACPSEIELGSTASVSWAACENAKSYDYKVTNGDAVVTEATGVTEKSFTIPAVTSGTSLTVTVTAVGPIDSQTTTKTIALKASVPTDITPKDGNIDKIGDAFRGIQSGQNVTAVLACFEQETEYLEVYSSDGTKLGDDAPVGTGCTVRIVNTTVSYVLIVIGDIDGDSNISTADYARQKNSLKGICALGGAYSQAADINNDGICSALDIAALKSMIAG